MKWFSFEVGHKARPESYHINLGNVTYIKFTEKSLIIYFTQMKKLLLGTSDINPDIAVSEAELRRLKDDCRNLIPD